MHPLSLPFLNSIKPALLTAHAGASASETTDAILIIVSIVFIVLALIAVIIVSRWKIFQKAGKPGWTSIVPIYNSVVWLEMIGKPLWWIVLLLMPFINIVISIIMVRRLAAVFGKGTWFTIGMIFLPFIFFPILAFGNSQYANIYPAPGPISEQVKWTLIGAVVFLLVETFSFSLMNNSASNMHSSVQPLTQIGSDTGFATDGSYVYLNDVAIDGADPSTFKLQGDYYEVDANTVYYNGVPMTGVDRDTFTVLSSGYYSKDKNSVYSEDQLVPGANPATFQDLGLYYGKDGTAIYYGASIVPGADATTFQVGEDSSGKIYFDAKDKNHLYSAGSIAQK
jgi:hypothetical protein